jgi:uncharacterized GH25 family protein
MARMETSRVRMWILAGLVLAIAAAPARSHEIKVLLDRMSVQKGDTDVVFLSWGHRLPIDRPTRAEDVEHYQLMTPSGSVRQLSTDGESDQRNVVHLEEEGLYTASAVRKPAVMTIYRFGDQHVHFSGPKTKVRQGARIEDSYRSFQFAKAMVVAGGGSEKPKPVGHTLEILPTTAPAGWVVGRDIPFQVLFEGKPISGKLFQAKRLDFKPDDVWTWTRPTDQDGMAVLTPDRAGTWLLKATVEQPATPGDREQFDGNHWTSTLILEVRNEAAPALGAEAAHLARVKEVHGATGPWAVAGYRIGERALKELGLPRQSHDLEVVHRCPAEVQYSCIADGVQAATGASPGKLNLRIEEAVRADLRTVILDKRSGRTLTFTLEPEFARSIADLPMDRLEAEGRRVAALPDDAIFRFAISTGSTAPK